MSRKYLDDIEKCIELFHRELTAPALQILESVRDDMKKELDEECKYKDVEEKTAWDNQESCGQVVNEFLKEKYGK